MVSKRAFTVIYATGSGRCNVAIMYNTDSWAKMHYGYIALTSKDGFTLDELHGYLTHVHRDVNFDKRLTAVLFVHMDAKKDGKVDEEEFVDYVRKLQYPVLQ